jgi:hypothetical protein
LYAHLTAVYLDELRQKNDPQTALMAAWERFGEHAALTAELNASVGALERFCYWDEIVSRKVHDCLSPRPGENWLRFARRCCIAFTSFNALAMLPMTLIGPSQSRMGDSTGLTFLPKVFLLMTLTEPGVILGLWAVDRALTNVRSLSSWIRAALQAILWSVVELVVVLLFWWSNAGVVPLSPQMTNVTMSFLVGLPLFLLLGAGIWRLADRRPQQDKSAAWTTLEIGP